MSMKIGVRGWIVIELLAAVGIGAIALDRFAPSRNVANSPQPTTQASPVVAAGVLPAASAIASPNPSIPTDHRHLKALLEFLPSTEGGIALLQPNAQQYQSAMNILSDYLKQYHPAMATDNGYLALFRDKNTPIQVQRAGPYLLIHPTAQIMVPGFVIFIDSASGEVAYEDWGYSVDGAQVLTQTEAATGPIVVRVNRVTLHGTGCNALGAKYFAIEGKDIHLALEIPWQESNSGWNAFDHDGVEATQQDQLVHKDVKVQLIATAQITLNTNLPHERQTTRSIPPVTFTWNPSRHQFDQINGRAMSQKSLLLTEIYGDMADPEWDWFSKPGSLSGGQPAMQPAAEDSRVQSVKMLLACFQKPDGTLMDLDDQSPQYKPALRELSRILSQDQTHFKNAAEAYDFFERVYTTLRASHVGRYILINPVEQYHEEAFVLFFDPATGKLVYQDWLEEGVLPSIKDSKVLECQGQTDVSVVRINHVTNTGTGVYALSARYYAVDDSGVHMALQIPWLEYSGYGFAFRLGEVTGELQDKLTDSNGRIILTTTGKITYDARLTDKAPDKNQKPVPIPPATFEWNPSDHTFVQTAGRVMEQDSFLLGDIYGDLAGALNWFHRPDFVPGARLTEPSPVLPKLDQFIACFLDSQGVYADLASTSPSYKSAINALARHLQKRFPEVVREGTLKDYVKFVDCGTIRVRKVGDYLMFSSTEKSKKPGFLIFADPATGEVPWEDWECKIDSVQVLPHEASSPQTLVRIIESTCSCGTYTAHYFALEGKAIHLALRIPWNETAQWKTHAYDDHSIATVQDSLGIADGRLQLTITGKLDLNYNAPAEYRKTVALPPAAFVWNSPRHQFIQTSGRKLTDATALMEQVYSDLADTPPSFPPAPLVSNTTQTSGNLPSVSVPSPQ